MKATEAIREVMTRQDVRFSVLCNRLAIKSNTLAGRIGQDNISIDKLNEMLRAMDYKIVVMPQNARMNAEWIEIE